MSDTNQSVKLTQYERPEHIFPTLTATQIESRRMEKSARCGTEKCWWNRATIIFLML